MMSKKILTGIFIAGLTVTSCYALSPASAGAYGVAVPTLSEACHDLHIAFLTIASANQSAPSISRARQLDQAAFQGCARVPGLSISKLMTAIHLVTPL